MNRLVSGLIVLVILSGGFLCWENRENRVLKKEVRELQVRLAQSEERADTFYIHDSIPVAKIQVVEVDKTDYKKALADKETIKELGLRVKQLESENRTLLATRDTVILSPLNDSVLGYKDKWVTFKYLVNEGVLDYAVRDSLTTYVARQYKHKFLWFRWGTKGYEVYIVSHNPRSRVEYSKFIKLK
jgi:hypothetical protein